MDNVLDFFGETLINEVRDRTIEQYDMTTDGRMKDEQSQRLSKEIAKMDDKDKKIIQKIIPEIVDLALHNMLCMLEDNPEIEVNINDENINEVSDGLAGELYTEDGWIQRFTKERYEEE